jgi:5,10-methylenetetrahydromethanopterin reductase
MSIARTGLTLMAPAPPVTYGIMASRLNGQRIGMEPVEELVWLESLGVPRVWLPHLLGLDPLPVFAAAAARTSVIRFGTAVTPTWPRHPLALMQEALAVQAVSDGRLSLGVGVSDVPTIQDVHGLQWQDPIGHFREYLTVCTQARTGQVDFHGNHYRVHAALDELPPQRLPIIASGLNPRAIETAAQLADGLITLLAPPSYLLQVIRPQIDARLSRQDFSLVACVPVILTGKTREAASAAQEVYGPFWGYTGYASMLRAARCNDVTDVAVIGDEDTVTAQLARYAAAGVTEIVAAPLPVPEDPAAIERTVRFTAELAARN